jgi:hypothetical protein
MLGAAAAFASSPAWAEWLRDDVVVYAEPALKPVMASLGASFRRQHAGTPRVFVAPPVQMLGLLAHGTQADMLITQTRFMDQAAQAGLVAPGRRMLWRNRLVVAGWPGSERSESFSLAGLREALAGGVLAVPDATDASAIDGPALLRNLGYSDAVQGAVDTADALDMVRRRRVALAICHATELAAAPELTRIMALPDESYPPILYQGALTASAWSRNQMALLDYLAGTVPVHALGLEVSA